MADVIEVEVAYVDPQRQLLRRVNVRTGSTIDDALAASGVLGELGLDPDSLDTGIWSKRCPRETLLKDGDRVELYRALTIDPMEARRARAAVRKR